MYPFFLKKKYFFILNNTLKKLGKGHVSHCVGCRVLLTTSGNGGDWLLDSCERNVVLILSDRGFKLLKSPGCSSWHFFCLFVCLFHFVSDVFSSWKVWTTGQVSSQTSIMKPCCCNRCSVRFRNPAEMCKIFPEKVLSGWDSSMCAF